MNQRTSFSFVRMSKKAIIIVHPDEFHLNGHCSEYVRNPAFWHKITVRCNNTSRNYIFDVLMQYVHPFDFIPVCFVQFKGYVSFFLRNCSIAVNKLCKELSVPNPSNEKEPFKLSIILGYCTTSDCTIKIEKNILMVLEKRYDEKRKYLDLDNFHEDPDLTEYCVLSQWQILNYVLFLSRKVEVQHLSLRKNRIFSLNRVSAFGDMQTLQTLDLRDNLIEDISKIAVSEGLKLSSLFLDGNPLCQEYNQYEYINKISQTFPQLTFLDGIEVKGLMPITANFLCNMNGYKLVDQFLEHYFTLFDGPLRKFSTGLYDSNSMFSFSSGYLYSSDAPRLSVVPADFLDLRSAEKCTAVNPSNIVNLLSRFPRTKHDPYTFTVDLIYYTDETAVLTVTGRLKQLANISLGAHGILHFTRTFVMIKKAYSEYKILNDVWVVTNPTATEIEVRFECPRGVNGKVIRQSKILKSLDVKAYSDADKNAMEEVLQKITTLNVYWSKKFLEHSKYNLLTSLDYFLHMYESDKVPSEAFVESEGEIANHLTKTTGLVVTEQNESEDIIYIS